jgi:replicative DNA helicase
MITVYGIQILYIDHLAKMDVGDDEYHGLTKATKLISAGAKDMDIPIVLLHQLRRSDDKKKEHRPTLQHLRGSGAIEQDADTVIFVHREEYYTHKDEDKGVAELIVAKQRNGPTETAICEFVAQSAHFRDTKPPEF